MARVARLTPRFLRRLQACGVHKGSSTSAAVGATIAALTEAGELPGLLDSYVRIPPTGSGLVRRVAGYNLWLWYRLEDGDIVSLTVTVTPPVVGS